MAELQKLTNDIFFFNVPYKDIFVGIYVIRTEKGTVLFDAAGCDEDVDNYIVPALKELNTVPTHIFISHNHGDHSGGLSRAAALWPEAVILTRNPQLQADHANAAGPADGDLLLDCLQVIAIPGHTADSAALLDRRSNTLITGDCLQSYGIYGSGAWYGAIALPMEHLKALRKLRALPLAMIATAHDYHPVGMISRGMDEINARLDSCIGALDRLRAIMEANPQLDDAQLQTLCNDGSLPKVAVRIIGALREAAEKNLL